VPLYIHHTLHRPPIRLSAFPSARFARGFAGSGYRCDRSVERPGEPQPTHRRGSHTQLCTCRLCRVVRVRQAPEPALDIRRERKRRDGASPCCAVAAGGATGNEVGPYRSLSPPIRTSPGRPVQPRRAARSRASSSIRVARGSPLRRDAATRRGQWRRWCRHRCQYDLARGPGPLSTDAPAPSHGYTQRSASAGAVRGEWVLVITRHGRIPAAAVFPHTAPVPLSSAVRESGPCTARHGAVEQGG
jgi:hypothetical protein